MTALKCKICGGDIQLTGKGHGICDSCGCEVTLPRIDDDKRVEMFNRGNHFRQLGDYDRAYSSYEHIIAEDSQDAEAHWCLTLCRYGIEYELDSRTEEYIPTVSRMSYESVLEDPDYLAALQVSDEYTKELYRKEARKIAEIQDRYKVIAQKEAPYDVFISFKAEDENGDRTRANILAQDIYDRLTKNGLRVFFSRISLQDHLGEAFEPYIFAALHSAKVMLLVATRPEEPQTRWVKNEWKRFLTMKERNGNKEIIKVYDSPMSVYDFPDEIIGQSADMSRPGMIQDLMRAVFRLAGRTAEGQKAVAAGTGISVENLMMRVSLALEDQSYDEANSLLEEVLNRDAKNGEAYFCRFLAEHELQRLPVPSEYYKQGDNLEDEQDLVEELLDWCQDRYFKLAERYAGQERKEELAKFQESCIQVRNELWNKQLLESAREKVTDCLSIKDYKNALYFMESAIKEAEQKELGSYVSDGLQGYEEQCRAIASEVAAYHKEIGDPKDYIERTIQQREPAKLKKFRRLEKDNGLNYKWTYDDGIGILALVFAVMATLFGCGVLLDSEIGIFVASIWALLFVLGCVRTFFEEFLSFWPTIIISVILGVLAAIVTNYGFGFLLPLLSAVIMIVALIRTLCTITWNIAYNKKKSYRDKVIIPLVESIRQDVHDRWHDKIGVNLEKLPGV